MGTDEDIKHDVLRELAWDSHVDVTEVGVEVDQGIVTLSGTVSSYGKKVAAQNAAHHVDGVHDVVNAIEVKALGAQSRTDTELARMVRQTLEWDVMVPDELITSTVENDWITLEGTVEIWAQREEADRAIRHLAGVRGVSNLIQVAGPPIEPEKMRQDIQEALARRAMREAHHIEIAVDGRKVTLSGRVQSWREKRAIVGVVSHTPGVGAILEDLWVDPVT